MHGSRLIFASLYFFLVGRLCGVQSPLHVVNVTVYYPYQRLDYVSTVPEHRLNSICRSHDDLLQHREGEDHNTSA
jgi:hypothetical protein